MTSVLGFVPDEIVGAALVILCVLGILISTILTAIDNRKDRFND